MQADKQTEWMTTTEVAAELKVSLKSLYALIKSGAIKANNVSMSSRPMWRVHRERLEEFKESVAEMP